MGKIRARRRSEGTLVILNFKPAPRSLATNVLNRWRLASIASDDAAPQHIAASCQDRTHAPQQKASFGWRTYSITSSAMARSDGGTVRSSIVAVWALMTNSNLLDCTTGKSAGLAPLRMPPA
jgi:hypothetical protein